MMIQKVSVVLAMLAASSAFAAGAPTKGDVLAAPCAGCHGTRGASPGSMTPIIGGQQEAYLKKAMKDFAAGSRPGTVMANFAKGYSDEQIAEMSASLASQKWLKTADAPRKKVARPADHATCAACHGAKGEGGADGPRIAAQAASYLKEAMLEYKAGKRSSEAMEMFRDISEKDLNLMAAYYARLK
jgi:sulfide dehydrogenase cytochrome subunit